MLTRCRTSLHPILEVRAAFGSCNTTRRQPQRPPQCGRFSRDVPGKTFRNRNHRQESFGESRLRQIIGYREQSAHWGTAVLHFCFWGNEPATGSLLESHVISFLQGTSTLRLLADEPSHGGDPEPSPGGENRVQMYGRRRGPRKRRETICVLVSGLEPDYHATLRRRRGAITTFERN